MMDPNNPQPQGENANLGKLEEDLQKLTKEASAQVPAAPPQPVSQPPVAEVPSTPVSSVLETTPPQEKKGSPVLIIALVLMVVAILAAIAYVVGVRFFASPATATPIPTEQPLVSPVATASSSAVPTVTPKASATASATPSASPQ